MLARRELLRGFFAASLLAAGIVLSAGAVMAAPRDHAPAKPGPKGHPAKPAPRPAQARPAPRPQPKPAPRHEPKPAPRPHGKPEPGRRPQ